MASQTGATATGATQSQRKRHASARIVAAVAAWNAISALTAGSPGCVAANIAVAWPMNNAAPAPTATSRWNGARRDESAIHTSEYTDTAAAAIIAVSGQGADAARADHTSTTSAAAAAPATWNRPLPVESATTLTASVSTPSAPNICHGGSDHSGLK